MTAKVLPPLKFNGTAFVRAEIEIDHINFGLDLETKQLNKKRRSKLTVNQVIGFLRQLHGEYLLPKRSVGGLDYFVVELYSPLRSPASGKLFRLVFTTNSDKRLVGTITLFRIREKKNG